MATLDPTVTPGRLSLTGGRGWLIGAAVLLALAALFSAFVPALSASFPTEWNLGLRAAIDGVQKWIIGNRNTHPLFVYGIDALARGVDVFLRLLEDVLIEPPWTTVVCVIGALGFVLRGWRMALTAMLALCVCGLFGLWEPTQRTLALMFVSVTLSLLIGIPLGVLAAQSPRFNALLQPVLDTMQTLPAFVYLIPVILIFGIGRVPSVVATMIYAVPPVIRLTALGIQQVPLAAIESATAYGSTKSQLLWKVQLPLALPVMLAGVNQTIMMALGMVVISAMIGTPGLGQEVYLALPRLRVGLAFEAGLAIVLIAIVLDRLSGAFATLDLTRLSRKNIARALTLIVLAGAVGFALGLVLFPVNTFPLEWRLPLRSVVDDLVTWLKVNVYWLTSGLGDIVTLWLLNPLRDMLTRIPWPVAFVAIGALAYRFGGWLLAIGGVIAALMIGLLGMWAFSMDTLSQVFVTLLVTAALALPLGVLASQSRVASGLLRPINDLLQTLPTFVFLVPVMMLFNLGRVPGLIAAVLYAIPVGIKLIELGIRQVAPETVEAARAFGSTRMQTIAKVQLPLARAAIAIALNQMTMMVLAMTIISGMVGGTGLGQEAVTGFARNQTGQGIEAGLAIVLMAIVLDRIMQAWARQQGKSGSQNG